MSVTYDAGALIAVDRADPLIFARHRQALSRGVVPVVPAPVIWQVWRDGSRQARLARFLKGCWVEPVDDDLARDAGVLLGRAGTIDGVTRQWCSPPSAGAALCTHRTQMTSGCWPVAWARPGSSSIGSERGSSQRKSDILML